MVDHNVLRVDHCVWGREEDSQGRVWDDSLGTGDRTPLLSVPCLIHWRSYEKTPVYPSHSKYPREPSLVAHDLAGPFRKAPPPYHYYNFTIRSTSYSESVITNVQVIKKNRSSWYIS